MSPRAPSLTSSAATAVTIKTTATETRPRQTARRAPIRLLRFLGARRVDEPTADDLAPASRAELDRGSSREAAEPRTPRRRSQRAADHGADAAPRREEQRRMRFGLVHRIMTDALAALGVLARREHRVDVRRGRRASSSSGSRMALAVPESWQSRPALRHLATIGPLALFAVQAVRLLAGRPALDVAVEFAADPPDHPPRDAPGRGARSADHRPRAPSLRRRHRARRRARRTGSASSAS